MATITTHYKGGMLFETAIGKHTLTIDVPAEMGGSDRGPQPPQLFIASLGSCIGAFVAQYAERAGMDASGMTVDINFEKAADPTRLVNLRAIVKLPNADCSQRVNAIQKVAEHCPVHATIQTMQGLEIEVLGHGGCHIEA
ncbi:MAG: OsmC family protein [Chloroflexota bacterium]